MTIRRESILETAIREFATKGYEGTSTSNIARVCGVTQPLIHYHFASKENLWRAAMDHLYGEVRQQFIDVPESERLWPARDRLTALIRRFVHLCSARPEVVQTVVREAAVKGERFDWLVQTHLGPVMRPIAELAAEALGASSARATSPVHLVFIAIGGAQFLFSVPALMESVVGMDPRDPAVVEAHADAMAELLERLLVPSAAQ
jgi:AcrR family transcriptional regulator